MCYAEDIKRIYDLIIVFLSQLIYLLIIISECTY